MGSSQPTEIWKESYWIRFRERVHIILAQGYEGAKGRIKAPGQRNEPAITGFIVEAIEQWLLVGPDWCDEFEVKDDPPIHGVKLDGQPRTGRERQRPDIIIGSTIRPRPRYYFEAKRLQKKGNSGDYTNSTGMGCFINGEYAPGYPEAAMLGYVEIEDITYWQTWLKREIDERKNDLGLLESQKDAFILYELPLEWESKHERSSVGFSITIFHILLDCRQTSDG